MFGLMGRGFGRLGGARRAGAAPPPVIPPYTITINGKPMTIGGKYLTIGNPDA